MFEQYQYQYQYESSALYRYEYAVWYQYRFRIFLGPKTIATKYILFSQKNLNINISYANKHLILVFKLVWYQWNTKKTTIIKNTSLAAKGALAHHLQRLQNPKWPPGGPIMVDGVWKGLYP